MLTNVNAIARMFVTIVCKIVIERVTVLARTRDSRDSYDRRPPRNPRNSRGGSSRSHGSERMYRTPERRPERGTYRDARTPTKGGSSGMSFSASVVAALFFGFVVVYMAWSAYGFFQPSVVTEIVRMSTMESPTSVPGMIIRNEQVIYSPRSGYVIPFVGDFDRVREHDLVFTIRDRDSAALDRSVQNLANVEEQIIELHEMIPHTQADPAIAQINAYLLSAMDRSIHQFSHTNVQDIYTLLDRLNQRTANRNQFKINEAGGARADLRRDREILTQHLEAHVYNMYATRSGIMSPFVDGFESEFTPANMHSLGQERVSFTIDAEIAPRREVEVGDPVFKIVNNTWYVVSYMPPEMVRDFEVGQERTIYLENASTGRFEPVPMQVRYIEHLPRVRRIIFRSNRNVIEFLNQRSVNIRTTDSIQSGLKIPASAVTQRRFLRIPLTHLHSNIDGYYVLHRTGDEGMRPLFVTIYNRSTGYVYVPFDDSVNLRLGDIIVPVNREGTHHHLIEADIRVIRGVYRTNLGYADFRRVYFDGEIPEVDGPIILDPSRNPNLRQFDPIVTDASTVWQGKVIN